jgi:hypothetical protein
LAKIKKRKLVWKPSNSPQVVGYKLYWSENGPVDYQSQSVKVGNITEIVLPDDVEGFDAVKGPVELGITAMDELGNESDLVTLKTPYQFNVPKAPSELWIETLQQYHTTLDKLDKLDNRVETVEPETPIQLFGSKAAPTTGDSTEPAAAEPQATTSGSSEAFHRIQ